MRRRDSSLVVFAGPSVPRAELLARWPCTVLPPARQGDVWRALRARPRALLLVDGVFEQEPSVWHRELLCALESGVAVFGAASMGALRAAELDRLGMIGVGQIYRWYRDGVLVDDAEVALLHAGPELEFRPLTVPLVNVRHAAELARKAKVLRPAEAKALVQAAGELFYQRRRWPSVVAQVGRRWSASAHERWRRWAAGGLEDLKRKDALEGLAAAAELLAAGVAPPARPPSRPSSLVRRSHPALQGDADRVGRARPLARDGTRTLLLAAWAKGLGLSPSASRLAAARRLLARQGGARWADGADLERLAEDLALEDLLLDVSERLVPDGPGRLDGLALGLRRRATRR